MPGTCPFNGGDNQHSCVISCQLWDETSNQCVIKTMNRSLLVLAQNSHKGFTTTQIQFKTIDDIVSELQEINMHLGNKE